MRLSPFGHVVLLTAMVAVMTLVSCRNTSPGGETPVSPSSEYKDLLTLTLSPSDNPRAVRLSEGADAGFFMVKPGTLLGATTTIGQIQNARYGLEGATLRPRESAKAFSKEASATGFSIVGYAPYRPSLDGFSFPLDISNQSDTTRINVLRFTSIDPASDPVRLRTERILPRLLIFVTAADEGTKDLLSESSLSVTLSGALLGGTYDIATGTFDYDGLRGTLYAQSSEPFPGLPDGEDTELLKAYLLPGETLSSLLVTVTLGKGTFDFRPAPLSTSKGGLYLLRVTLKSEPGTGLPYPSSLSQQEWDLSGTGVGTPVTISSEEAEKPLPEAEQTAYMERPFSGTGHPDAVELDHFAPDGYFSGGTTPGGERRNYSIYFSREHRLPLWVAYPLYPACMGSQRRDEAWQPDPKLDESFQPILDRSYAEYAMTRGHMCPSGSRDASKALMHTTYYYTNMIPQDYDLNGGTWLDLENKERVWARDVSRYDTIYIVTGPILYKDLRKTSDKHGREVSKPEYAYKAILARDKRDGAWYSMAVKMPNVAPPASALWSDYMVTVRSLEEETGFVLFPNLPENVSAGVKQQLDKIRWR